MCTRGEELRLAPDTSGVLLGSDKQRQRRLQSSVLLVQCCYILDLEKRSEHHFTLVATFLTLHWEHIFEAIFKT